ncbi:MAG: glycosyltransferase family A protein [Cytophagales bacterium]
MLEDSSTALTIVCLCHNHSFFLEECLDEVEKLASPTVQVILVDDGSDDGSKDILSHYSTKNNWKFININQSIGNCKAFNQALEFAQGEFILDLATDDVLIVENFKNYIQFCVSRSKEIGFFHANALYINKFSELLSAHFATKQIKELQQEHPCQLFKRLFEGSLICPPTVIFRTQALKQVNGYDEALSFEDFDAWMRLSRSWKTDFFPETVIKKRLLNTSSSFQQTRNKTDEFLNSVHKICQKAIALSQINEERLAIAKFSGYHLRLAFYVGNRKYVEAFWAITSSLRKPSVIECLMLGLSKMNIFPKKLYFIYQNMHWKRKTKVLHH